MSAWGTRSAGCGSPNTTLITMATVSRDEMKRSGLMCFGVGRAIVLLHHPRRLAAFSRRPCLRQLALPSVALILFFVAAPHLQSQTQGLPAAPSEAICVNEAARQEAITACTLNVQAGVPYSGKVAEYRSCAGESDLSFSVIWDSTTKSFAVQDQHHDGVLSGTHTWTIPGEYQLRIEAGATTNSVQASQGGVDSKTECATRGRSAFAPVHVFAPMPPVSMFISARKLHSGHTYTNAGAVALRQPAPPAGMLLMLETNQPGKVDVQTSFGRTAPGKKRTYLWVKPGSNTRSFDLIVASGVPEEFEAEIRSDCAGTIVPKSECDATSTEIKPSKVFPIEIH